jgi:hypothetical protein
MATSHGKRWPESAPVWLNRLAHVLLTNLLAVGTAAWVLWLWKGDSKERFFTVWAIGSIVLYAAGLAVFVALRLKSRSERHDESAGA